MNISLDLALRPNACGMLSVLMRASQNKNQVFFEIGVTIFPQDWDYKTCRVKSSNPNYKELNNRIRKSLYDIEGFALEQNKSCSLSRLKRVYDEHLITHDWYEMFESKINSRQVTESTKNNHRATLKKLRDYAEKCDTSDLNDDFFKGFHKFLLQTVSDVTADKHMQVCRTYYHIAKNLYGDVVPFCSFDWHKPHPRDKFTIKALNEEDIRKIENYVMKQNIKEKYRLDMQRFLFMCYTGMRISDFKRCTKENFSVEDGVMCLSYTSQKTHIFTKVPISRIFDGRVEQLLAAHEDDLESFFWVKDRCHFNERIKKICKKEIGIEKKVTTHCGRHTFATRLVNRDIPLTTIAKVIGHSNIKTTMIYAKTSDDAIVRQLCK